MKFLFSNPNIIHLINNDNYPVGGASILQYALAQGLANLNQEVGFLTFLPNKKNFQSTNSNFDLVYCYDQNKGVKILRWLYYRFPRLLLSIIKYKPDVVIEAGAGAMGGILCLISKICRKRFVYFITSDWEVNGEFLKNALPHERYLFLYTLKKADIVVSQNNYQKENLRNKYGIKSFILRTPFQVDYKKESREFQDKKSPDQQYILWVGNFRPAKGVENLLKIAQMIPGIKIKVTGKQIYSSPQFNSLLAELMTLPNIDYLGYILKADLVRLIQNARALLCCSTREGFPTTFIEAWFFGIPVVTLNYDPDNLIQNNNLGFVCKDHKDVALILTSIIDGKLKINKDRIKEYTHTNHSPVMIAQQLLGLITKST